jgi:iron complex transport system ATP-binding protein
MAEPNEVALKTYELSFRRGAKEVLKEISLEFKQGRHYFIAGPNGAGKSTLLDLISRLKSPSNGCIELLGHRLERYEPKKLAKILSLAPQNSRFDFGFTVREIIALGRRPHLGRWGLLGPEDQNEIDLALNALGLEKLADKLVTALSGGEAQRVVLARTLAQSTPIILLDEPTNSLDVAQALELMISLQKLTENGRTIITVTHDLSLAACFGQEIIFLKDGRLAAHGPKENTFTAEKLREVFEAEALVRKDDFTGGLALSFRKIEQDKNS